MKYARLFMTLFLTPHPYVFAQAPAKDIAPSALETSIQRRIKQNQLAMPQYLPKIQALQKEINQSTSLFLTATQKKGDAGLSLNPRLTWDFESSDTDSKKAVEKFFVTPSAKKTNRLMLPEGLLEKLKNLSHQDLVKKAPEFDLRSIDLTWISQLKPYDHWNIEENSPLAYVEKYSLLTGPSPNFVPLIAWARLRLIKGIQEQKVDAAIEETLHLGRLVHSTETLLGAVTSVAIQRIAISVSEDMGRTTHINPQIFDKAKLYFIALPQALSHPLLMDSSSYVHLLNSPTGPGFCAAINQAGVSLLMTRPLLEMDMKDIFQNFGNLLKTSKSCRWYHLRKAWSRDPKYIVQFASLLTASSEQRRQAIEQIKSILSEDEYKNLIQNISNPRWPQYFGYAYELKSTPDVLFSNLK